VYRMCFLFSRAALILIYVIADESPSTIADVIIRVLEEGFDIKERMNELQFRIDVSCMSVALKFTWH